MMRPSSQQVWSSFPGADACLPSRSSHRSCNNPGASGMGWVKGDDARTANDPQPLRIMTNNPFPPSQPTRQSGVIFGENMSSGGYFILTPVIAP